MTDTQRIVQIDPSQLVSELTVAELLDIVEITGAKFISAARVCVDFEGPQFQPDQQIYYYYFKAEAVQVNASPEGRMVETDQLEDPKKKPKVQRRYLGLFGTGDLYFSFPSAVRVDLYIANIGTQTIHVTFLGCDGKPKGPITPVDPPPVLKQITYTGSDLCSVKIGGKLVECLVYKLCYLPQ